MKLFLAVASLWAVAVFALKGDRYTEMEDRDVELFRAGQTYKYRLDTQISSGIAFVSDQHSVTRLQAEALVHFQSDRLVSLKLKDVRVATINQEIQEPEQIQPIQMFKEEQLDENLVRLLELPCEFDYVDGLVESIRFPTQDQPWSKNIKKSVLNMLQLNLKQRKGQNVELEQPESWQKEREQFDSLTVSKPESQTQSRMFVMPEITLEGECQVIYTLNPVNPRSKLIESYYDEQVSRDEKKMFNVTKTVDFHRCRKISDIRYGPKIEKPCKNCTSQQELEERKLDRTTIMRHTVVGNPTEKFGIKKVETVSHYVFKMLNAEEESPMRTIVVGRLNLVRADSDRNEIERELRRVETNNKAESLLYTVDFDAMEKQFYMFGDEEFPREQSPFEKIQDKVSKAEKLMKQLVTMWSDKIKGGIDSEATLVYTRLVELIRMCNQKELTEIFSRSKDITSSRRESSGEETNEINAEDILIDVLANAGTYNTIKVLADKIKRRDIQPSRATRAIVQLKDLPAPSEKQMKMLMDLCESSTCEQHEPCRQVCWLTVGNLVGELCDDELTVDDAVEQVKPQCHQQLKKDFVSKGMRQFEKFETRYKKIMLLKALGNAGLEPSVPELEKLIRNTREDPLVRMQAIDSLRRLRAVMPHKIQRVLLPLVHNVRERPEVRMMAISQILATFPERSVLDQIGYTLLREPNRQVKSFVYKAMKELAQSPIHVEKEVAQHLKALLKLAGITEEDAETLVRGSRYYRIPIYSEAKKEGLFVDFESMFSQDNLLPKHLSVGMDTIFNGLFQKNSLEISLTQEDIEQWFEKLMDVYMDYSYGSSSSKKLRGNRRSSLEESSESESSNSISKIFRDLGIQSRSSRRVDSDSNRKNSNSPYAMLNIRYGDVDYMVLPLEEEFLPSMLKKIVTQGRQPTIGDLQELIDVLHGKRFRAQIAMNLMENSVKIPTSAGLPVRMWHVIPLMASVEGQIQIEMKSELKANIKVHPMASITHLKRVEVWSPIVRTGVDSTRTVSINLPIKSQLQTKSSESPKGFQWSIDVPEKEFLLVNFHTLPLTYITTEKERLQQTPMKVKRIENENLVHRAQHIDTVVGKKNFGIPLKLNGEVHLPHRLNYRAIIASLLTTENHLHIEFKPEEETPRKIVLIAEGRFFQSNSESRTEHRQLKDFHSKSRFDTEMDSYYGTENDDDERRFNKFLDEYEPSKVYKHFVALELKSEGGRKEKTARIEIDASCDSQHRYAKALLKVKRSPLPSMEESSSWTLKTECQVVLPDVHSTVQEYKRQEDQKQQRFVAKINTEWGSESTQKQQIRMNINGEQGRNPEWRQKINEIERVSSSPDAQKLRQQMIRKAAFINKYDISAEYENIMPETKNAFNTLATVLKSWNFWQTRVESRKTSGQSPRDGQLTATVVIDPITHEHLNVTLKTPVEIVRIESLNMPMKMKPFKLVKSGQNQQSIDSFEDIIRNYAVENRQECKVSGRTIRSFDDVSFKAPLTKCYSVLAKDCGSSRSRFAVLMKRTEEEEKALKVLTREDTIEVEKKNGKLVVKINGKHVQDEDKLEEKGIDYSKNSVRISTRDLTVRFDGEQAWVKVADSHKTTQCGLCGHYDDDSEDEFRMSNNELTSDLKKYHKSYSVIDDECSTDFEDTHRREEYKQLKKSSRKSYPEWDDEDDEDDEQYRRQQHQRRNNENNEIDPIEKTETMEYNHKICFSVKPVKSCPEDSYPAKTKEMKVGFACLDRASSEARRLLREAQRSDRPISLPYTKPSFVETLTVPSACEAY